MRVREGTDRSLAESSTTAWLDATPESLAHPVPHDVALAALEAARSEATTHHG